MKKIFLFLILIFNLSYARFFWYSEGEPLTAEVYGQYMDYCFLARYAYNDITEGFSSESDIDMTPRLYESQGGEMILGQGEIIIFCYTEAEAKSKNITSPAYNQQNATGSRNNYFLKRGESDRCNGADNLNGYWLIYGCDPRTGLQYPIYDSYAGTMRNDNTFDCIDWNTYDIYPGSSYLHLITAKNKFLGVTYDETWNWVSYACVKGDYEHTPIFQMATLRSGFTTNSVDSSNYPEGGGTGGTGGTGGDGGTGGTSPDYSSQLDQISQDLQAINNQMQTIETIPLEKIDNLENAINEQNQESAINQEILLTKLSELEQKDNEISQKIDNLEITLSEDESQVLMNLQQNIDDSISQLKNELESNNGLRNMELNENLDDLNQRLDDIETALNGLSNGSDGSSNEEVIGAIDRMGSELGTAIEGGLYANDGSSHLGNITDSLNEGLFDSEGNSLLESIDKNIADSMTPNDDYSGLNSILYDELNSSFTNYSNIFVSSCSAPSNITMNLMGKNYTLLDFSVLSPYVSYIRGVFISLGAILGFLFFLRGSK
ncbi:MAG: hypothetical protein QW307_02165 [Thermoplasmata archaeon]